MQVVETVYSNIRWKRLDVLRLYGEPAVCPLYIVCLLTPVLCDTIFSVPSGRISKKLDTNIHHASEGSEVKGQGHMLTDICVIAVTAETYVLTRWC